jgi:hypothetical protein
MNTDSAAQPRRHRATYIVLAVALLLLVYIVSPYLSFWRFSDAVRAGNRQGVASHVDFPALRESLKRELRARFYPPMATEKPKKKDRLRDFLQGMAPSLIDTLVDAYITPDGVAALLADPHISMTTNPENVGASTSLSTARHNIDWSKVHYAFFTSPRDFLVDANGTKLRFRFSRAGWLLREIDLPLDGNAPATASSPAGGT